MLSAVPMFRGTCCAARKGRKKTVWTLMPNLLNNKMLSVHHTNRDITSRLFALKRLLCSTSTGTAVMTKEVCMRVKVECLPEHMAYAVCTHGVTSKQRCVAIRLLSQQGVRCGSSSCNSSPAVAAPASSKLIWVVVGGCPAW